MKDPEVVFTSFLDTSVLCVRGVVRNEEGEVFSLQIIQPMKRSASINASKSLIP